jgi:hypothetical protein
MILDSKMRYAHKGAPEEKRKEKMKKFEDPTDEKDELEAKKRRNSQKARRAAVEAQNYSFNHA